MNNKFEYKGLFYLNENAPHKYYEGGAHFKYIELFNALEILSRKNSYSKNKKEIKKGSLSQGKINKYLNNNNISKNKSKNKSTKNLLISENKTPINNLNKYSKKKIINNENKSLSKSKNMNYSHNYTNALKLGISQLLNLKIKNNNNLYNISDLENNSRLSNISKLKEKKIIYNNINIKHQPKSRNSKDKRLINKTKKDNISLINNKCDKYNDNYNYFYLEEKIDKMKEKEKIIFNKTKKIINSQHNNNYLDYFKITKITPRSRGSLNKNTVMLNIRKLKNKDLIQKTLYNINDNNSISMITNSFIKNRNNLSLDKNSKIKNKFITNSITSDDFNINNNNKKNIIKYNKSPIINDSLTKRNNMNLLTLNKIDDNLYKKNNNIENKIEKNGNKNNNIILKYINKYMTRTNGLKRRNSKNNIYCSYRNKYILNDLPKKSNDNTYYNANVLKNIKNSEMNINYNQKNIYHKMSSRNSNINNDKILRSLEDGY